MTSDNSTKGEGALISALEQKQINLCASKKPDEQVWRPTNFTNIAPLYEKIVQPDAYNGQNTEINVPQGVGAAPNGKAL